MRYETDYYARLFRDQAHNAQSAAIKNRKDADHNRKTLYAVMDALDGKPEAQEVMLQTCYEMGHNQTTLNALIRRMRTFDTRHCMGLIQ